MLKRRADIYCAVHETEEGSDDPSLQPIVVKAINKIGDYETALHASMVLRELNGALDGALVQMLDGSLLKDHWVMCMNYIHGKNFYDWSREIALLRSQADRIKKLHTVVGELVKSIGVLINAEVVHLDVSRNNVMVVPEQSSLLLIDPGFVRRVMDKPHGGKYGTPSTISPEMVRDESYSKTSDMYSAGCIAGQTLDDFCGTNTIPQFDFDDRHLYLYLRTHKRYFDDRHALNLRELPTKVPEEVRAITHGLVEFTIKALQDDPAARPQSEKEAAQILNYCPMMGI